MTPSEIHERTEVAYCMLEQDSKVRFMTYTEKKRNETVLQLLKEIMEGTS